MTKQPFVYVLPEQFIKDPTVPMHWKLYTILNGFWISGKPVFASNNYFAEKLGCSDRYIRECLEKLESMGLVTREGQSQNRRILPGAEQGGTDSSYQGGTSSSGRAEPVVPHISDSISDRLVITADAEEEPLKAKKPTKDILLWGEAELGKQFPNRGKQMKHIASMLDAGFAAKEIQDKWVEMAQDDFWSDKGFDFSNISSQIAKKKVKRIIKSYG